MNPIRDLLGDGKARPPAPEVASPEDVERYNREFLEKNNIEADTGRGNPDPEEAPFAKQADGSDDRLKHKADFPWLYDPSRGVRWDFDPVQLRNLGQANTWVGMLVQSITKEISETPWTIVKTDDATETQKRLNTHPDEREPIAKELPDRESERIHNLLTKPNPDSTWHDMVEMWYGDLLEVGSMTSVKSFPASVYDDDELAVEAGQTEPRALKASAPEVWTKDYHSKTGLLDGFWQFDDHKSPGSGNVDGGSTRTRGINQPTFFNTDEIMWTDISPRTNRRYGMPPTLLVQDFLKSLDLAITQEQQYLSRGSIPSGAWVFEEYDREELKEQKQEMEENVKGKPHKSLMFAGRGGNVSFEPMSMNFSELEFTERMQYYAKVVSSAFQVPTAVVGLSPEKINYNTFQGERENFENNTLGPYLMKGERWLTYNLIQPHWGSDYRFEFKPGMSETTRGMISERVLSEFDSNIRTRNEARREIGLEEVDPDENGFKEDVTEDTDDGLGDMLASAVSKDDETTKAFEADVFRVQLPEDHDGDGFEDDVVGIGVDFPNDAVYVDWRNEVFPDALEDSHVSIYGSIDDLEKATGNVTESLDTLDATRQAELAASVTKSVAGDSGNGNLRKDEPLRNTDEWHQFTVQPDMVESLASDIAADVDDLYDRVLSDDRIMDIIDRLAGADDDETAKSLSSLHRRLTEIFEESDIVARIESELRDETADAARQALEDAIEDTDEDPDVDVDAINEQLSDREVEFADSFANRMSEEIRETVGDGWKDGLGTQEIADNISEQADMNEGWNGAEKVARQELHIASGEARSEFAEEIGKVEIWNDSGDGDRVRDAHQEMDGTWKWPGDSWVVDYSSEGRGVVKESTPGNSEPGIGCRCGVLLRDRSEVDESDYAGDGSPR